jgi:hypothetical protein
MSAALQNTGNAGQDAEEEARTARIIDKIYREQGSLCSLCLENAF